MSEMDVTALRGQHPSRRAAFKISERYGIFRKFRKISEQLRPRPGQAATAAGCPPELRYLPKFSPSLLPSLLTISERLTYPKLTEKRGKSELPEENVLKNITAKSL